MFDVWPMAACTSNSPPTLTGAGHQRTVSTNIGCDWWLSLAKTLLKVVLVGKESFVGSPHQQQS